MAGPRAVATPHDRLIKRVLRRPEVVAIVLRRALPTELLQRLDLRRIRVEPTTLISPRLGKRRVDLIVSVGVREGGGEQRAYIPIEHQSSPDPRLPVRMMWTTAWLWESCITNASLPMCTVPPVLPVVLAQYRRRDRGPIRLSTKVDPMFPVSGSPHIELTIFVDDLSEPVLDDPVASPLAVALWEVTRALLFAYHHPRSLTRARVEQLARRFDLIIEHAPEDAEALWTYILSAFDEGSALQTVLLEAVGKDNQTMCATTKEVLIAEGLRKGRTLGIAQGLGTALLQLLEHRALGTPPGVRQRVLGTSDGDALKQWFSRALTATTLDDIFGRPA